MVGRRPTTDLLNIAKFGCSDENDSCSGGYPELIYSVWGDGLIFYTCLHACTGAIWSRAVVVRRPTTHLLHMPSTTDLFHVLACAHGRCLVMGRTGVGRRPTPEPPAGARMKGA